MHLFTGIAAEKNCQNNSYLKNLLGVKISFIQVLRMIIHIPNSVGSDGTLT